MIYLKGIQTENWCRSGILVDISLKLHHYGLITAIKGVTPAMEFDSQAIHPALTLERLKIIVQLIAEARIGAADRHDLSFGDDAQVLGMRAYKNLTMILSELAGKEGYEWLAVYEPRGRFTILIDGVPLRIWRENDPDKDAENRRMEVAMAAVPQLQLFPVEQQVIDRLGIVYQTDVAGQLQSAFLVGFNSASNTVVSSTPIRIDEILSAGLSTVVDELPKAVSIPKVASTLKLKKPGQDSATNSKQ